MRKKILTIAAGITLSCFGLGQAAAQDYAGPAAQPSHASAGQSPAPPQASPVQTSSYWPTSPAADNDTPPRGYAYRPRYGLIIAGTTVLGSSYLLTAGIGIGVFGSVAWPTLVPVLGPWIQMGIVDSSKVVPSFYGVLAVSGLVQAGGLAMIIAGAVAKKRLPLYSERLQLMPYSIARGGGLLIAGRF